jgi:hypothetical protein
MTKYANSYTRLNSASITPLNPPPGTIDDRWARSYSRGLEGLPPVDEPANYREFRQALIGIVPFVIGPSGGLCTVAYWSSADTLSNPS